MASVKRLVTPTKDLSFDAVYAPFGQVPAERTISPEVLGITDPLTVQIRFAAYKVGKGELTVDEAVAQYGSFQDDRCQGCIYQRSFRESGRLFKGDRQKIRV